VAGEEVELVGDGPLEWLAVVDLEVADRVPDDLGGRGLCRTAERRRGRGDAVAIADAEEDRGPDPGGMAKYIQDALKGQTAGHMLPWVVRDLASGTVVGSTRYHDIVAVADRVEIGWTWYSASRHRTHVNTTCKVMLLAHAFDTLGCKVVGLRTDNFNFKSQRAIEALGAKKDGVIRHHWPRRDGTVRDSVMYSILATEWPDVRRHLELRLARNQRDAP